MTKKITILFCFIMYTTFQFLIEIETSHLSSVLHITRSFLCNRAYGITTQKKKNEKPKIFAPNMHIGHEISLFSGVEFGNWKIKQNSNSYYAKNPEEKISPFNVSTIAPSLFLRYAYQFPFTQNFGLFLGTTFGTIISKLDHAQFRVGYAFYLPSIMIGLTFTPTQNDRLMLGSEYNAIWYPEMTIYTDEKEKHQLGAALGSFSFYLENDYFFSDKSAFSVSAGVRFINNACHLTFVCPDNNYLYSIKLNNSQYNGQVGFVFDVN